jgi:prepilin-type N-terminal cleavage/methylation domain-containing protein
MVHKSFFRRTSRRGYSLIEVLMTSLIIQIIAGIVTVSMSSAADTERTSYAAQDIVTAIRYARQLAQSDGVPCGVIFDTDNNQVRVFRGSTATIATNKAFPNGQYIIYLNQKSVSISAVNLAGPANNKVLTYGNIGVVSGVAKGLGSTTNTGVVTLSLGSHTKTVNIPTAGDPTLN